jgi:hypothetical protein
MDWYNTYKVNAMIGKLEEKYGTDVDTLNNLLDNGSFEEFCLACNYIAKGRFESYENQSKLRSRANARVKEFMGAELATLFDSIVKKSKQELWGGDQLYELFGYDLVPFYVRSCMKSALYIYNMIHEGIRTPEAALQVATLVYDPPYWDITNEHMSDPIEKRYQNREVECKTWNKIAECIALGEQTRAYEVLKEATNRSGRKDM